MSESAGREVAVDSRRELVTLYRVFSPDDSLLYVGISAHPRARFRQHQTIKRWWASASRIELEHFGAREDAERAERAAIRSERPRWNVEHSDRDRPPASQKPCRQKDQLISTSAFAAALGFTTDRVVQLIRAGTVAAIRPRPRGHYRIPRGELERLVREARERVAG